MPCSVLLLSDSVGDALSLMGDILSLMGDVLFLLGDALSIMGHALFPTPLGGDPLSLMGDALSHWERQAPHWDLLFPTRLGDPLSLMGNGLFLPGDCRVPLGDALSYFRDALSPPGGSLSLMGDALFLPSDDESDRKMPCHASEMPCPSWGILCSSPGTQSPTD
jgi:hypothetical protein